MSLPSPATVSRAATGFAAPPSRSATLNWLRAFWPARMAINARERWRACVGAALGIACSAWVSHWLGLAAWPWLAAPIGASAVLVFAVPASPLAQPWSVVGGNTLSALVGIACVHAFGAGPLAAAVAVAVAIAVMFALRCLHPPGGASALFPVLAGIHSYHFALFPVLGNSLLLVAAGMAYNELTGRRYPHAQRRGKPQPRLPAAGFSEADLDAVLARYNQVLDVPRDDLQNLLQEAERLAYGRRLGGIRCADVMSTDLATVAFGTPLQDAWALLRQRSIKALPVIDGGRHVIGIVTLADFMRHAELDLHHGFDRRLRALLRRSPIASSDKPEVVGHIMTRQVRVATASRYIAELVPLFSATGHHHIPILGDNGQLAGIITQSDLVRAIAHPAAP